ncbi:MAG: exodeoxyribonuclease III [Hyphomonas sp.]|uniref:exodeoxyribonuclease III n=1 Tax=Hyphomonas sp. TaxID=87 RepID=UPI001D974ECC|nr:exodeoxyribonuclease III [Hyphomonas sp.]MBA4225210.1 exodeoxyribonuclease III [Hyphomonas sp.]
MRIATWNVNSMKARLPTVLQVLTDISADVVCLQELKCETDAFPYLEIEEMGWNCAVHGQKSYNGVAILSKFPLQDVTREMSTLKDDQARYIEATVLADRPVRVGGLYLPNGNPAPGEKYDYKLEWVAALEDHARSLLKAEEPFVLCGDYNAIPAPEDCWDDTVWNTDALGLPETRAAWRQLKHLGLTDAFEACDGRAHQYTFWDYQGGAFQKDHGIRIDHILACPRMTDRLTAIEIYRKARAMDKPSDHVPVIATFED